MGALAEIAADIASIGHNGAPEPTPYEAVKTHIDDLITEAKNWADGKAVENQAQADQVSRLIEDVRLAIAAADEARVEEKRPLDEQITEIQTRYNALIADNKTLKGSAVTAMSALKATLKAYLDAEEAKRAKAAEVARLEAQRLADIAAAAMRAADVSDLGAREEAEQLLTEAKRADVGARQVEQARPQARGGSRAVGLRKTYTAEITNPRDALLHYWGGATPGIGRDALIACLRQIAQQDVNRKVHTIPGVTVVEGTTL